MNIFKNILVVQTAFPGDIVLTTPLFKVLKKEFPNSRLSLLTTPPGCQLLQDNKEIDSLIPYDKKGEDKGIHSYFYLIARLREMNFDLCIAPHRSARTSLMVLAARIKERIGYTEASFSILYTKVVVRDKNQHEVNRILSLLNPLSITVKEEDKQPSLALSQESKKNMGKRFDELGIKTEDLIIGVAPGSVWNTKMWIPEGFAAVIDNLIEAYDAKVLLLGAPSDSEASNKVISLCKNEPIDLVGKTTLKELIAVIDRCQLMIGNDSAPGHVASARNVPVISIFGPTVPAFGYAPFGKDVIVVEKEELPCRPCHHHGPQICPKKHFKCMKEIKSEYVMEQVKRIIK